MLVLDTQSWAEQQFSGCKLGDARRTARLVKVGKQVIGLPAGSFPEQMEKWGDLKAAYRLFDRDEVTFEAVASCHWQQTRNRSAGRYLVLGDTTELDFGIGRKIPNLKPTGNGGGRGFLLHSGLLVSATTDEIFGLAAQTIHYRQAAPKKESSSQRLKRDRESKVWGDVIDAVGQPAEGVELVHVLDRGADNFEVYCHCKEQKSDWVVRVTQKTRKIITPIGERIKLRNYLSSLSVAGKYELTLRARPGQTARIAQMEVRYGALQVPPPEHASPYVKSINTGPIDMNVVMVRELNAPDGVEPIEWVLLTSLSVNDFYAAWEIIGYYEKRWTIEEWHKALKTGCNVTGRQLQTAGRLEAMVGLMSVVSVRLLQLKSAARVEPDRLASEIAPLRWIQLLTAARPKLKNIAQTLTIREFYREMAKLGGFIGRKSDGEPGWITIWRGWQKLYLIVRGAELSDHLK